VNIDGRKHRRAGKFLSSGISSIGSFLFAIVRGAVIDRAHTEESAQDGLSRDQSRSVVQLSFAKAHDYEFFRPFLR
jgi:hypothetical protein